MYYTTQAVRGPITKISQSKCSIAGPIFSKYRTGHCLKWSRTCVFAFFSRVINLLLTKLALDCSGRILALGLFCTDLAALGPYYQDLGPIFSQYGPRAWLIRCIYWLSWGFLIAICSYLFIHLFIYRIIHIIFLNLAIYLFIYSLYYPHKLTKVSNSKSAIYSTILAYLSSKGNENWFENQVLWEIRVLRGGPGAHFLKACKAIAKTWTLQLQSCFIHIFSINMKRSSLHTRSFKHIQFSIFRYRWTKRGFTDPNNFQGFRETSLWNY